MDQKEFGLFRQKLQKTQKQMANLLGTSIKTIQSFEQGWRKIPVHIERQLLFLLAAKGRISGKGRPCWDIRGCSVENRSSCPAWEFKLGNLCWFIKGTICQGESHGKWSDKMSICKKCRVFASIVKKGGFEAEGKME